MTMFEEVKPLQEKEYQILKELKRVCDKNGLQYYLIFGTLIGAVRHKGFIPWDDDIDVCMNYEDYVKLDEACARDLAEGYFLQTSETDPESRLTYKKIRMNSTTLIHEDFAHKDMNHGISIDIYPVFHLADDPKARKKQVYSALIYLLCVVGEPPKHHGAVLKLGSEILLALIRGRLRERVKSQCLKNMTRYQSENTAYRTMMHGFLNCRKQYPAECFEEAIPMLFEDEEFSAPKEYDKFLKIRYGDYMKLPPAEEQGVKLDHLVKVDTERSYLDYKGIYYCVK